MQLLQTTTVRNICGCRLFLIPIMHTVPIILLPSCHPIENRLAVNVGLITIIQKDLVSSS